MKISSRSSDAVMQMSASHSGSLPLYEKLRHGMRALTSMLDHMGAAIASSEAGKLDADVAHALREKHTQSKN